MMSRPLDNGAYRKLRSATPGAAALIVAVRDFSGFTSSDWAFAKAAARAATESLDRCTVRLRLQQIKTYRAGFRTLCPYPMPNRLFGILRNECLEFALSSLMLRKRITGAAENRRELGPGIRGTHVDYSDRLNTGPRRLGIDEMRDLTGLYATPEFLLGGDQNGQIERVHGDGNLDPFAAAGDDREHRTLQVG